MGSLSALGNRSEETNEEQDHNEEDKRERIFQRAPESLATGLAAFFGVHIVILLIPEICKRHHQQTQDRIQRVKEVIYYAQGVGDLVDFFLGCPVFPLAQS